MLCLALTCPILGVVLRAHAQPYLIIYRTSQAKISIDLNRAVNSVDKCVRCKEANGA